MNNFDCLLIHLHLLSSLKFIPMFKLSVHSGAIESGVAKIFVSVIVGHTVPRDAENRTVEAIVERVLSAAKLFHAYTV